MDLAKEEEARDIINILIWRSQGNKTRDLSYLRHHANPFPKSLTHSTFSMGILTEEDQQIQEEQPVLTSEEFGHITAYFKAQGDEMAER